MNRRGIPARKRKKNSLIYGSDDLVSIPVKSPKKKIVSPTKPFKETPKKGKDTPSKTVQESYDDDSDEFYKDQDLSDMENDFNDDLEPSTPPPITVTPKKSYEVTKVRIDAEEEMHNMNKLNAQRLGYALRNLLKLPKAHKWVCFEFFYSNIDRLVSFGNNKFYLFKNILQGSLLWRK